MTEPAAPTAGPATDPAEVSEEQGDQPADDEHQDTFPREYVEQLRTESKGHRERAKTAEARTDELARALFTARVAATGKLASPDDLPFDAALLDDDEALTNAIDGLIEKRPHYAARKPSGSVGQGVTGRQEPEVSWLGRLTQSV